MDQRHDSSPTSLFLCCYPLGGRLLHTPKPCLTIASQCPTPRDHGRFVPSPIIENLRSGSVFSRASATDVTSIRFGDKESNIGRAPPQLSSSPSDHQHDISSEKYTSLGTWFNASLSSRAQMYRSKMSFDVHLLNCRISLLSKSCRRPGRSGGLPPGVSVLTLNVDNEPRTDAGGASELSDAADSPYVISNAFVSVASSTTVCSA